MFADSGCGCGGRGAAARACGSRADWRCRNSQCVGLCFDALDGEAVRGKRDSTTHDRDPLLTVRANCISIESEPG
jgi:hypothetical protein